MVMANVPDGVSLKKKKTKGRKKIEIKKIEETNSRQVTFSKRRAGLFKKASELCVLTGAQIAILVSSPGGRVFTYGHPNADLLIDRYLNENNIDTTHNSQPPLPVIQFNQHYEEFSRELEMEKKRRELIPGRSGGLRWYEEAVDGMELEELEQYLCSLVQLKKKAVMRAEELTMIKKFPVPANVFDQMEWNNNNNMQQTMDIPVPANNTTVHAGFNFHHGGEMEVLVSSIT